MVGRLGDAFIDSASLLHQLHLPHPPLSYRLSIKAFHSNPVVWAGVGPFQFTGPEGSLGAVENAALNGTSLAEFLAGSKRPERERGALVARYIACGPGRGPGHGEQRAADLDTCTAAALNYAVGSE